MLQSNGNQLSFFAQTVAQLARLQCLRGNNAGWLYDHA
ncbi:hypothetical protein MNBD_ALPHA11-712 [hydrothermal vent metagenome]|uniref:Uncharacterized protein n=1 Tax=hydrothermal vent metagenome TaxID=652676 RepID=A0A3B0UZH0_9ZZZZ